MLPQTPGCCERRSVIFVANLLSLFFGNRGGARRLEEEIRCVDSYGGRLLPVLDLIFGGDDNVLVLERRPDPALTEFFHSLGLATPRIEICTRQDFLDLGESLAHAKASGHVLLERLRSAPASLVDGFVTDDTIVRLAESLGKDTLSTVAGSQRGNNKLLLHEHLESRNLPVFPTRLAASAAEVPAALVELQRLGHRHAVLKAQIGASGIGLMRMPTDQPPAEIADAFFHEGACMVQAWLEAHADGIARIFSPSVQIFVTAEGARVFDVTEQILDPEEGIHEGNESPPLALDECPGLLDELHRQAGVAANWLYGEGYRGAGSVDFLLAIDSHGGFTAYICEINARITGATYPSVLARHFRPSGAWRMCNLELADAAPGERLLEKLRDHGELFAGDGRDGILPVNFNLDPDGLVQKGQFLAIADDVATCRRLFDTARHDLPVAWDYTSDR